MTEPSAEHLFKVDLRGVVDLLSHHLYTSPRVYARELLQNAVDAIAARRAVDPDAPAGEVLVELVADGSLRVSDNGVGLTEPDVHTLLANVGRTSKRDELGFARQDFLGQFGIGLLSCFMVCDDIEVVTRSVTGTPAVRWHGFSDGRYTVGLADDAPAGAGTTVVLRPRPGAEHWLAPAEVTELVRSFGHLLPEDITVVSPAGTRQRITEPDALWERAHPDAATRREALLDAGAELLGRRPMDVLDLSVPEAGLRGVAFVLPTAAAVGQGGHTVYLKRMLLTTDASKLLPEWAFFVRCVVDATHLRPTAGREALYEDDLLAAVRDQLGERIRTWLLDLSVSHPDRLAAFLRVHHLGIKALAVRDDEMLRLVEGWLPFETSRGTMSLSTFRRGTDVVWYTETVDEFRALAAIAGAAGTALVNAGYAYDVEVLQRLARLEPSLVLRPLDPGDLAARLDPLPPGLAALGAALLDTAREVLADLGCAPLLRQFEPVTVPALYLTGRQAREQEAVRRTRDVADDLWSDVLSAFQDPAADHRPQLVLNWRHPLIRRLAEHSGPALRHAVAALYGQALLAGHHPLRAADTATMNRAYLGLIDHAFAADDASPTTGEKEGNR